MSFDTCKACGAKCCQYFCFEIDEPDDYDEFEDVRWYICHEGVSVHIDEGNWFISIMNRCNMLDDDNQCTMYDDRPLICRKYDLDNCDQTMGDYGYDEEFNTPEELAAYARRTLGAEAYNYEQAKHRATLGGEKEKALFEAVKKTRRKTQRTKTTAKD
ncbi:MAG: YkgJ family cysteine cluster protein [Planctomycetota bacterium]|jgi:Fe-S-cluster containining protein